MIVMRQVCSSIKYFCVIYQKESCIFGYEGGFKKKYI